MKIWEPVIVENYALLFFIVGLCRCFFFSGLNRIVVGRDTTPYHVIYPTLKKPTLRR